MKSEPLHVCRGNDLLVFNEIFLDNLYDEEGMERPIGDVHSTGFDYLSVA